MKVIIDGTKFSTLDEFFNEFDIQIGLKCEADHNLDAFCDTLRGGFGRLGAGEKIEFIWKHAAKSRHDLDYEATVSYWESVREKCHPANRDKISSLITSASRREGKTLFTILVEIIMAKESGYNHSLVLID